MHAKRERLMDQIISVESIAHFSKLGRLIHHPFKYLFALGYRTILYPFSKRDIKVNAHLFFNKTMKIALPSSTDIYLTGGKSHSSEIRLAKWMILNLNEGNRFLDIGAHYGYFSLLAAEITGNSGRVISCEPSPNSFHLLHQNLELYPCITGFMMAVSDVEGIMTFYEFPNLYSEYNSFDISQFEKEDWFRSAQPKTIEVKCSTIDQLCTDQHFKPDMIKIDVEGSENKVIQGGLHLFKQHAPMIVMEYLAPYRTNESHRQAIELLQQIGYESNIIISDGQLKPVTDIDFYLQELNLESDNIVMMKRN